MKYVLRVVNALAAAVILVALVVLLRAVFTPAGEVPTIGGYSFMRTLTGSMEPAIPTNSFIVSQEVDPAELQVGDVITFRSTDSALDGALNTHRITQVYTQDDQLFFRTKGDANALEDASPVSSSNVVGRVVFVSAALGTVVSLLSNPLLFFPLIVLPLLVLLVLEIVKMVKSAKALAEAEEEAALREAVEQIRRQRAAERDAAALAEKGAGEAAENSAGEFVEGNIDRFVENSASELAENNANEPEQMKW